MQSAELLSLLRVEIRDTERPHLFEDEVLYAYLGESQRMFCRLTEGIEDARSYVLSIVQGEEWYPLDPRILKLRAARNAAGGPVAVVNSERADQAGIRFDGRAGPLKALVAGAQKGALRAWPVPAQEDTVALEVFRLPAAGLDDSTEPEIDEQHHLALLLWTKHLVFDNIDADVYDPRKAAEYETRFRTYCAQAKAEQGRARHQAGAVQYGGW